MSFEKIFTDGNLVAVTVSLWTAKRKLRPEDLGLSTEDFKDTFALGTKKLVPAKTLQKIFVLESRARILLSNYSFKFSFGGARFVPKKKMIEFSEEIDKIIQEFNSEVNNFLKNYPRYKMEMRSEYTRLAKDSYQRACKLKGLRGRVNEDSYVNKFLERIEKCYPKEDEIKSKFNMSYTVFKAALPDLSIASVDDLVEEDEKLKVINEVYRENIINQVKMFIDETAKDLRGKAKKIIDQFNDLIVNDKYIRTSSIKSFEAMVKNYEKFDFIGDSDFYQMLRDFYEKIVAPAKSKDFMENAVLRAKALKNIKFLYRHLNDERAIEALVRRYREKINI